MGRKSTTPLISLSASLLAVWFKVEDEGCHHFKCPMFARGLPLKPHTAYSMKVVHLETPEWSLLPWPGSTYPRRLRWRVAFWAIVVTRVQANDWSTYSSGNQWEINPYSWWLNKTPLKNMFVTLGINSPKIGVNIKHIWVATTQDPETRPAICWAISGYFSDDDSFSGQLWLLLNPAVYIVVEPWWSWIRVGCWIRVCSGNSSGQISIIPIPELRGF